MPVDTRDVGCGETLARDFRSYMPKPDKQLDAEILHAKVVMKLLDYAEETTKKLMRNEGILETTDKHADYVISLLREYIQKDYGC